MFSVNIDKLVATTPAQEKAYKELCNRVLAKGRKYKTLAVIGESGYALRLAAAIVDAGNKVLFVDADVTTPVFMGKYRLGKNLEGLCEYLDGTQDDDKIRCLTNRSDLNIIFSGESSRQTLSQNDEDRLRKFLDDNMDDYDYIIRGMPCAWCGYNECIIQIIRKMTIRFKSSGRWSAIVIM